MEFALNAAPPHGHVIASEKWRNSSLIQSLRGNSVFYEIGSNVNLLACNTNILHESIAKSFYFKSQKKPSENKNVHCPFRKVQAVTENGCITSFRAI